jgi:hypothetical protein
LYIFIGGGEAAHASLSSTALARARNKPVAASTFVVVAFVFFYKYLRQQSLRLAVTCCALSPTHKHQQ